MSGYCRECGAAVAAEDKFCEACGTARRAPATGAAPAAVRTPPARTAKDGARTSTAARGPSWVFYYGLVILAMSFVAGYRDGNAADGLLYVGVNYVFLVLPVLWVHRVRRSRRLERELA